MRDTESWTEIAAMEDAAEPSCILDGHTMVDTPAGPMAAASLGTGDLVTTFDDGPRRLCAVERHQSAEVGRLVLVPAGLIGNADDLLLAPDQNIIVESDVAEALTGSPFAVIPVQALEAVEGVRRSRAARARNLVSLSFVDAQAVTVAGGAILVTPAAAGMPCLLHHAAPRYAPIDAGLVGQVVESLGEASLETVYAAMA